MSSEAQARRAPARQCGAYCLEGEIGRGGMGAVHRARDVRTGARVAVKFPAVENEGGRLLIRHESALLQRLAGAGHPGIVRWLEAGAQGGMPWYAMELIEGPSLDDVLAELWRQPRGHPPRAANGRLQHVLLLVQTIADTLACAHALGVVHCDLTPRNVLLRAGTQPVLIDFGTSLRAFSADAPREAVQLQERARGTVGYVSPEQLSRGMIDARSDMYALGCILYALLTGRPPFVGDRPAAIAQQHLWEAPEPPSCRVTELPRELESLTLRLLEKDPRRRTTHATDVVQLLSRWFPADRAPPPRQLRAPLFRPGLRGREAELSVLQAAVEQARLGRGSWLMLSGDSGSGKTRLVSEFTRRLGGDSMVIVGGSCGDPGGAAGGAAARAALEPFLGFLRWLADRCALAAHLPLFARLARDLAVLAPYERAVSELSGLPTDEAPELPAPLARKRVLRSLRECLLAVAETCALVLVLDDLHAADELSLDFLNSEHMQALWHSQMLMIGTRRAEHTNARLQAAVSAYAERELRLEPLDVTQVRAMIGDMLGEDRIPHEFVAFVQRKSAGNPLYVAEYLRIAVESHLLGRSAGRWHFPEPTSSVSEPYGCLPAPSSLHEVARLRLAPLAAEEARVMAMAAVLGQEFEARLLEPVPGAISSNEREGTPLLLEALVARGLLEPASNGRWRFTHATLCSAARTAVSADASAELHRVAAERKGAALAHGSALEGYGVDIGRHWAQAGQPARALSALVPAAARAEQTHAYELAIELYALAVEQCSELHGPERPWPADALALAECLGDLLARTAQHVHARKVYASAIERAAERRLVLARLWRKYAETHWKIHEHRAALQALESAAQQLGADGEATPEHLHEHITIQQARFSIHYFENPHGPETAQLVAEMLPSVESYATPQQRSYFFQCVANEHVGRNRYRYSPEAVSYERRALRAIQGEKGCVVERALAEFDLGFMLLLGDGPACEEAVPLLRSAAAAAERFEDLTLLSRALTYLAMAQRRLRQFAEARHCSEHAREIVERTQLAPYVGVALANLSWAHWHAGDVERARALALQARAYWSHPEHVFPFQWLANLVLLDMHAADGLLPAARELLAALIEPRQQLLPDPLDAALRAAFETCPSSGAEPVAPRALDEPLALARQYLYL